MVQVGNFQKRELILNDSWERNGEVHENYVSIEFTGEKMAMLDTIMPGQRVTVEACVNGREYQGRYYTSIRGLSVAPYQPQQQAAPQQQYPPQPSAPGYAPQQQYQQAPGYAPAPAYPQQAQYPQQYQQAPQQAYPPQGGPAAADLPFPPAR